MKKSLVVSFLLVIGFSVFTSSYCQTSGFQHFIRRKDDLLVNGDHPFRFLSLNIPNLLLIEDNMAFQETNPWRLPDEFEIRDAFTALQQIGGQVARTYVLTVRKPDDPPEIPRHVLAPGIFNEQAFQTLDKVLQLANEYHIRLIIPLVDNWSWMGGRAEYAAFRHKNKDDFWSDSLLISDFKKTIEFVMNRRNTWTGRTYTNDKAILAWETGNELEAPPAWTHEIASYIKHLDPNHLVMDGFHTPIVRQSSLLDNQIDVVSSHHYEKNTAEMIQHITGNARAARGKKPYIVGEFGFLPLEGMKQVVQAIQEAGVSGALLWSLRFRNRDGGFYWHSEPFGGDLFKSYLWPGFATGRPYHEKKLFRLVRTSAYQMQKKPMGQLPIPAPPHLLPIRDISAITWQGSVGAESYNVERAQNPSGPWKTIGKKIVETEVQYRPLFNDTSAVIGRQYYYRVRAWNDSGISPPSNQVGPIRVSALALVDEMKNFSLIHEYHGSPSLETKLARRAKEDLHRVKGEKGTTLVYKVAGTITSSTIFTFFPDDIVHFSFALSQNGKNFFPIDSEKQNFYTGRGDYNYWKPVCYRIRSRIRGACFLKIQFATRAELSRVEIHYKK